jgi:hypothetical protein
LTEVLGRPERTSSGQTVWVCRFGDEPALVTIATREPHDTLSLRVLQAPEGSSVEVCAVKYLEVSDRGAADQAVAQLARDAPA